MKVKNLFSKLARRETKPDPAETDVMALVAPAPVPAAPFVPGEAQKIILGPDAVWDTGTHPHLLVAGPQGTGKTTLQRLIIEHCLNHETQWRIYGVDLYRTQLTSYVEYGAPVEHIARSVSESILDLRLVQDEMRGRLLKMKKHGVASYRELSGQVPAIMVIIDESYHILPAIMTPAARTAAEFDVRIESLNILKELMEHGARAGVHISMGTRAPDQGITDDLRKHMTCRVVTGASNVESSLLVLGNEEAVGLEKGQSYIQYGEEGRVFTILNP